MLRKLQIAIDCADYAEREQVQQILAEISGMRILKAKQIIQMWPFIQRHQSELIQLFNLIARDGVKAIVSVTGGSIIAKLIRS